MAHTKEISLRSIGFDEHQIMQLNLATQYDVVNSEIFQHTDWPPNLMNICWNRERSKEPIKSLYSVAEYVNTNFGVYPIGKEFSDNITILLSLVSIADNNGTFPEVSRNADGSVNRSMTVYKMVQSKYRAEGVSRLVTHRLSLNTIPELDYKLVMAEGDEQAYDIVNQLGNYASTAAEEGSLFGSVFESRAWNMSSIILELDDMNIRGKQLVYALDYVDGVIEKLYEILSSRSRSTSDELRRYINHRTAMEYKNRDSEFPMNAVSHGASFQRMGSMHSITTDYEPVIMSGEMLNAARNDKIEPLKTDWSKVEIQNSVSIAVAKRACEARGFKLVRDVIRKGHFEDETLHSLIWYNPDKGDYIKASSAKDTDLVYGGAELFMVRETGEELRNAARNVHGSSGPINGLNARYYSIYQHDGLFRQYSHFSSISGGLNLDWSKIGFGISGVPIPRYVDEGIVSSSVFMDVFDTRLGYELSNMGNYLCINLINRILACYDEELQNSCSPHYKLLSDWMNDVGFIESLSFWSASSWVEYKYATLVLSYLEAPQEFVDTVKDSFLRYFEKRDELIRQDKMIGTSNNVEAYLKHRDEIDIDKELGRKYKEIIKLPDPRELQIKLPWFK